ncbi:MAG: DUF58 domain-containing protein [Dehalococcoidia bacterium]|nr:DUF58 domain-containing protein [Dehalococcoidia bacterium]
MSRVRGIEIRTRKLAASGVAGNYRSVFRGSGIEFAEAREYVPGDDVRRIDWNVTARMGTPWVKEFVEERDLSVISVVDRSPSMLAATPERGRLGAAAELVALLGFSAAYNNDRTGLLTFSDGVDAYVEPRRGTRHVLRQVRDVLLADIAPGRGTAMAPALDHLARVLRRRSVVFVISDFFTSGYAQSLQTLARRHDVIALTLIDPLDLELPDVGLLDVLDAETGRRLVVDSGSRRVREAYREATAQRAAARDLRLSRAGVDRIAIHLDGDPDSDVVEPVASFFRRRAQVSA